MPRGPKPSQHEHLHQVPYVKTVSRRIETYVSREPLCIQTAGKPGIRNLMDEAAKLEVGGEAGWVNTG
jgi:hypothetical protein